MAFFSPKTHPRAPLRKLVSYCHAGRQLLTLTLDLGPDGMRIETHYPLPDGEELNLNLILGNKSLWVKGRVDGEWQDDPNAQEMVGNPYGCHNCVRIVG